MSNVFATSTAQAINALILAHMNGNLDRISRTYGNLEWELAQDGTESVSQAVSTTADGIRLPYGIMACLWSEIGTPYSGTVDDILGGYLTTASGIAYAISTLYFDKSNCKAQPTTSTFLTKDKATVKPGKFYSLWHVVPLTGEILKLNGRVSVHGGDLYDLTDSDEEQETIKYPLTDLYFWRVNCLKDEFAAVSGNTSTSTTVEVDSASDNTTVRF